MFEILATVIRQEREIKEIQTEKAVKLFILTKYIFYTKSLEILLENF